MGLNIEDIKLYAERALNSIFKNRNVKFISEVSQVGSLTLKTETSIDLCGFSTLLRFMFMKDGEIYFYAIFGEIELSAENAAHAFNATASTALNIALNDYLVVQLGSYLFREEDTSDMISRYFEDLFYLIKDDDDMKILLHRMK